MKNSAWKYILALAVAMPMKSLAQDANNEPGDNDGNPLFIYQFSDMEDNVDSAKGGLTDYNTDRRPAYFF